MSIFPYIYYMISSFKITRDDTQIAIYAGMVTSAFAFAEFSTGVIWGRLSDKIGRKPVLLGGLAGTGLSMMIFGFASNLPVALAGRALGGLLNGYDTSEARVFEVLGLTTPSQEHWCSPDYSCRNGYGKGAPTYDEILHCVINA